MREQQVDALAACLVIKAFHREHGGVARHVRRRAHVDNGGRRKQLQQQVHTRHLHVIPAALVDQVHQRRQHLQRIVERSEHGEVTSTSLHLLRALLRVA